MKFVYWKQRPWAPKWRGGRVPRRLKKALRRSLRASMMFGMPYVYPGHPEYESVTASTVHPADTAQIEFSQWGDVVEVRDAR